MASIIVRKPVAFSEPTVETAVDEVSNLSAGPEEGKLSWSGH